MRWGTESGQGMPVNRLPAPHPKIWEKSESHEDFNGSGAKTEVGRGKERNFLGKLYAKISQASIFSLRAISKYRSDKKDGLNQL